MSFVSNYLLDGIIYVSSMVAPEPVGSPWNDAEAWLDADPWID